MADKKRIDEVGAYIEKYYVPDNDDIKLDKEMHTIFDRITSFREKRAAKKNVEDLKESETDETYVGCDLGTEDMDFDVASMQKKKITTGMPSTMSTNRNIDDLMAQMEETFSQRLLRMIDGTKQCTYNPDHDNIIPITDEEYFSDDIVGRFVEFVEVALIRL